MADPTADALTPMADLAGRWGITANTVSRRLAFLGIKPIRQGNYRFLTPEQLATAERLHQHILSGKPMESFPRPEMEGESRLVARRVPQVEQVAGQVPSGQLEVLAAAMAAAMPTPPVDPLRRARLLADAADLGVPLTTAEVAEITGMAASTVSNWADGHSPRPGFRLRRQKVGAAVWWTVERPGSSETVPALAPAPAAAEPKRAPGFLACIAPAIEAHATVIGRVSLPSW